MHFRRLRRSSSDRRLRPSFIIMVVLGVVSGFLHKKSAKKYRQPFSPEYLFNIIQLFSTLFFIHHLGCWHWPKAARTQATTQTSRHKLYDTSVSGSLLDECRNTFSDNVLDICLKTCEVFRLKGSLWAQVLEEFITISFPHIGIKPRTRTRTHTHTHTHTQTQSESVGDSNEGLGLQCRWCGVTSSHRNMYRIRFTPTESPSTSTSHLFLFHKTSREDDTSDRVSISPPLPFPLSLSLSLSFSLFLSLSCTKKSRGERGGGEIFVL